MNTRILRSCLIPLALAGAALAHADEAKAPTPAPTEKKERRVKVIVNHDGQRGPMETVTFLGVEATPADAALAAQLGLADGTGLVVRRVLEGSAAAGVLREHDVLTRFADQILVDQHQLSVLVRSHQAGDEVALTFLRGGKETTVKVKLTTREVPKMSARPGPGPEGFRFFHDGGLPDLEDLQDLPGLAREDVDRIVRELGQNHSNLMGHPQVRIIKRKGGEDDSTILDLNQGNIAYSDEEGSLELKAHDGKRELTVKNPKGEVTFQGPLNGDEDRKKLPAEVAKRLEKLQQIEVGDKAGADFQQEGVTVRKQQKISLPQTPRPPAPPAAPSF